MRPPRVKGGNTVAKITEKTVRQSVSAANANSKHMLVGLQFDRGTAGYNVHVISRKTGVAVQSFPELSASEAHAAVQMFDISARVSALQTKKLLATLDDVAGTEAFLLLPGDLADQILELIEGVTK